MGTAHPIASGGCPRSADVEHPFHPLRNGPGGPHLHLGALGVGDFRARILQQHRSAVRVPPRGGYVGFTGGKKPTARGLSPGSLTARRTGIAESRRDVQPRCYPPGLPRQHGPASALCGLHPVGVDVVVQPDNEHNTQLYQHLEYCVNGSCKRKPMERKKI